MTRSPTRCRRCCTGRRTPRSGWTGATTPTGSPAGGLAGFLAGLDDDLARPVADDAAEAGGAAAGRPGHRPAPGWPARPTRWCSTDGGWHGRQHRRARAPSPRSASGTTGRSTRGDGPRRRRDRGLDRRWRWPTSARATVTAAGPRRRSGPPTTVGRGRRAPGRPGGRRSASLGATAGRPATSWSRRSRPRRRTPSWSPAAPTCPVVFEVVYDPWPTPLARRRPRDRVLVAGLDLLVHQAALQFALFTGPGRRRWRRCAPPARPRSRRARSA